MPLRDYRDGSIDVEARGFLDETGFTPVDNPELERAAETVGSGVVGVFNWSLYGFSRMSGRPYATEYFRLFDARPQTERRIGKAAGLAAAATLVFVEARTGIGLDIAKWGAVNLASAITPDFRSIR